MTESPRIDRDGILIERDLADSLAIEEELDANVVGPYRFPTPRRRRVAAWIFLLSAVIALLTLDRGWVVALGFVALAVWHFASAWPLEVHEHQALEIAAAAVGFPVGHASAAVTFTGLRSKPSWSVVLYSVMEPPDTRGLVVIDAVTGEVSEAPYVEAVPSV